MKTSNESSNIGNNAVLISIHPQYANKIISGEKRIEFRRRWTKVDVSTIVIYSTAPVGRIVAIANVVKTISGSPTKLWEFGRAPGTGITREKLFEYLKGTRIATAIELGAVQEFTSAVEPSMVFGEGFRPPQSFRYMRPEELSKLELFEKRNK